MPTLHRIEHRKTGFGPYNEDRASKHLMCVHGTCWGYRGKYASRKQPGLYNVKEAGLADQVEGWNDVIVFGFCSFVQMKMYFWNPEVFDRLDQVEMWVTLYYVRPEHFARGRYQSVIKLREMQRVKEVGDYRHIPIATLRRQGIL